MNVDPAILERVKSHVDRRRLLETAQALIEVPSPTGSAGAVADRLAQILDGRRIQGRPALGRLPGGSGRGGSARERRGRARRCSSTGTSTRSILPFAPPAVENGLLTGSGASDMKGGIAAAVEALRAIRDAGCLKARLGPADGPRPARSPLGRRPPARPAHSRGHPRRCRALARAALQRAAGRRAEARRPGRSSSAARGPRSTRSCARATSRA